MRSKLIAPILINVILPSCTEPDGTWQTVSK